MSKYKWLIDAGHGGMKDGVYTTAPGKMFKFEDGFTFYEGVNNRAIANKLIALLKGMNIDYAVVYDEHEDTSLSARVNLANVLQAREQRCIYLSIHSDAMPDGAHGKASGSSVWTSVGQTKSDVIAEIFYKTFEAKGFKMRPEKIDGDNDHEQNFYVISKTTCPALLVENMFYDNRKEAEFLASDEGQTKIAIALMASINEVERTKPI